MTKHPEPGEIVRRTDTKWGQILVAPLREIHWLSFWKFGSDARKNHSGGIRDVAQLAAHRKRNACKKLP